MSIMEKIDFLKLLENNKTRGYEFYDCGIAHKNMDKYLTQEDENILMTKTDIYTNDESNFVIDLDDIWKWLGFQQKAAAKKVLIRNFNLDLDYKILNSSECKKGSGGHNKEIIMMNIKTFNLFCLKGDTLMSGMLHEYYIKIERAYINSIDDEYTILKQTTQIEDEYIKSLDELVPLLTKQKVQLVTHLIKNYKENYHYIIQKPENVKGSKKGGQNKINYMLTEYTFELLKNSYNFRNKYITNVSDNVKCINVAMCLENQTIGFIENSFKDVIEVKRQYMFDNYKVDLYFPEYKLVVECDENNHTDRAPINEKNREQYILSNINTMIRFNPNDKKFELSIVLREINKILFSKNDNTSSLILLP